MVLLLLSFISDNISNTEYNDILYQILDAVTIYYYIIQYTNDVAGILRVKQNSFCGLVFRRNAWTFYSVFGHLLECFIKNSL